MDIKRLLNKKGWTGRELGIIELTNMCVLYRQAIQGEEEKPLVTEAQFRKMLDGIKDRSQGMIYNDYLSIHEWLSIQYNIAQTQLQQAQLHYKTLEGNITEALIAEDTYRYIEQLPAIMTQKQYDDNKAEKIEAFFKDEDGEELYANIFELIERTTDYFLEKLQNEPEKANPLKAIRKKYVNEPVESEIILSRWNEVQGEGYYTLEDGRRSDQMSDEEWRAALTTPEMEKAFTATDATDESGEPLSKDIALQRSIDRARVIFNGGTEKEADEAQRKADIERGWTVPCEWHCYTDPPTDVTKWDVIEQKLLFEFYPASLDGGDAWSESNFTASMKDFKQEFSELVKAMLKEIDKKHFKGEEGLSNIPVEEWGNNCWSRRELYEKGFFGVQEEAEADTTIFSGNRRALFNGIAIIKPCKASWSYCRSIDENGYYKEPDIQETLSEYALEAFFPESEYYAVNTEIIDQSRELLLNSYYYLLGYNYTLDRIAALHDVPDIAVFKQDIEGLAERIDLFNNLVPMLYKKIKDTDYEDKELQSKKLQALKDFFQPIDYKSLAIPEANKAEAEELIRDFTAFKQENTDRFTALLYTRPTDGEGAE